MSTAERISRNSRSLAGTDHKRIITFALSFYGIAQRANRHIVSIPCLCFKGAARRAFQ